MTQKEALNKLIECARLLGATQAKQGAGTYTQEDSRFEAAMHEAIAKHSAAIKEALTQEQEPVAYIRRNEYNEYRLEPHDNFDIKSIPFNVDVSLFKSPQRKPWVSLTPDQVVQIRDDESLNIGTHWDFYCAVDIKLRELNEAPQRPSRSDIKPLTDEQTKLATEAVDQIMKQAQVFAAAWSLVIDFSSRVLSRSDDWTRLGVDFGNAMEDAEQAKAELQVMVKSLAQSAVGIKE